MADSRAAVEGAAVIDTVDRLIALDEAAWGALYEEYFRKMRAFAYARTGDISAAEDIASDVFAAAVRGISGYRKTGAPISAWLYRIARNLTADHLDRQRKRPRVSIEETELDIEAAGETLQVEERHDLIVAMRKLTREQQELIALRFFNDASLEDAAHAMGKSVGAVKVLQHRALGALRRQMKPRGETR